jgi:hypothetical protein
MDPYRTPGQPEIEGLVAELGILRQANGALAIQVAELREELRRKDYKIQNLTVARDIRAGGTVTELTDRLRAALVFLKQADKKNVFNRSQGVAEIISKIEGVPGVKDG